MIDKTVVGKGMDKIIYLYDAERHIEICSGKDDDNDDNFSTFIITAYNVAEDIKLNTEQLFTLYDMITEMKKEMGVK